MIIVRKLSKYYPGNVLALSNVSLVIPRGEFAFLVGPNGAGKTTFFKVLIREQEPSSGCVLFQGRDLQDLTQGALARHRRALGAVFQDARLVPTKTVRENVTLPLEADGIQRPDIAAKAERALAMANLGDLGDRFPGDLSGGQQQQVAIARALANEPQAILADEPTGNLSPNATYQIMRLLTSINRRGITVIVATHNQEIVDAMGKRVLVLDRGRLISDRPYSRYPEHLRQSAA